MISAFSHLDPSPALLHAAGHVISGTDLVVPLLAVIYMGTCFIARKEAQVLSAQAVTAVVTTKQHEQVLQTPDGAALRPQWGCAASKTAPLPAFTGETGSVRLKRGEVVVTLPAPNQFDDRSKYAGHTKQATKQQKAMGGAAIC
jgi:hypothetical protein